MTPGPLWALLLLGCLAPDLAPNPASEVPVPFVSRLTGEVHVHQFPQGGHAWASFLSTPVPLAGINGDQLVNLEFAPTQREGRCTLYLPPHCTPACTATALCLGQNSCVPLTPLPDVDAGEVRVTGSLLHPTIRLWFAGPDTPYDADPRPGATLLYTGGETLRVAGGTGRFAFAGDIPAPMPVIVTAPDLTLPLRFFPAQDLTVTWQPAGAQLVLLQLVISTGDRGSGHIRCLSPDSGKLTVPRDLMASLPPPPRSIRFELERDEERLLTSQNPDVGILTHATYTTWRNDTE